MAKKSCGCIKIPEVILVALILLTAVACTAGGTPEEKAWNSCTSLIQSQLKLSPRDAQAFDPARVHLYASDTVATLEAWVPGNNVGGTVTVYYAKYNAQYTCYFDLELKLKGVERGGP